MCVTFSESPLAGCPTNSKIELLCTDSVWNDLNTHTAWGCLNFMTPCSSLDIDTDVLEEHTTPSSGLMETVCSSKILVSTYQTTTQCHSLTFCKSGRLWTLAGQIPLELHCQQILLCCWGIYVEHWSHVIPLRLASIVLTCIIVTCTGYNSPFMSSI